MAKWFGKNEKGEEVSDEKAGKAVEAKFTSTRRFTEEELMKH